MSYSPHTHLAENGTNSSADWNPKECRREGSIELTWAYGGHQTFDTGVLLLHLLVLLLDSPPHLVVFIPKPCCLVSSIQLFPIQSINTGFKFFPKGIPDSH